MSPCPHWGYVLGGAFKRRFTDRTEEVEEAGARFYLPPGHTASVDDDTEITLFSPQHEHAAVLEQMADKTGA